MVMECVGMDWARAVIPEGCLGVCDQASHWHLLWPVSRTDKRMK